MSLESVRLFLAEHAPDIPIIELDASTATVDEAARAHGVPAAMIAKTLTLKVKDRPLLLVASGDARLDNRKLRDAFGAKAKMLAADDVETLTGHPIGGVCPFGVATPLPVFCDETLRAFAEVLPAAGTTRSAVRIAPARLAELTDAQWVDTCRRPDE